MIAFALIGQLAMAPSSGEVPPVQDGVPPSAAQAEQEGSRFRKTALPAAMSFVVPGSGQLMQGRLERGALHLGAAAVLSWVMIDAEAQQANVSGAASSGASVRVISAAALLGLALWSPLDAWSFGANDRKSD